jgi:hypothetical protein
MIATLISALLLLIATWWVVIIEGFGEAQCWN